MGDQPRRDAINDVIPSGSRWVAAFGVLPAIAIAVWYVEALRNRGFDALRSRTP